MCGCVNGILKEWEHSQVLALEVLYLISSLRMCGFINGISEKTENVLNLRHRKQIFYPLNSLECVDVYMEFQKEREHFQVLTLEITFS